MINIGYNENTNKIPRPRLRVKNTQLVGTWVLGVYHNTETLHSLINTRLQTPLSASEFIELTKLSEKLEGLLNVEVDTRKFGKEGQDD